MTENGKGIKFYCNKVKNVIEFFELDLFPATKRLKKLEYDLNKIINWENLDKVAVEHNCSGNSFDLTYSQVHEAKNIIKDCLNKLDPSEFIGIYYDTPIYCIPSLILG